MLAKKLRDFLPEQDLLAYCEAILRVYNLEGRRDNKYKARIKILMHEMGAEAMTEAVESEFAESRFRTPKLDSAELDRIAKHFDLPALASCSPSSAYFERSRRADRDFNLFAIRNVFPHRVPGYGIVIISLKPIGGIPGDATADQMEAVADLAERFSSSEIRVTHAQNLVLPHVRLDDIFTVYSSLKNAELGTPNAGLVTDIIACPGLDYCSLANARSISVAQRISQRFADRDRQQDIGDLQIKISGCINACGHHHVGHIGILGVDRLGEEFYQITLGGSADETCAIGTIVGRSFSGDRIVDAVETIVDTFLSLRNSREENFLAAYRRIGSEPFRSALYGGGG